MSETTKKPVLETMHLGISFGGLHAACHLRAAAFRLRLHHAGRHGPSVRTSQLHTVARETGSGGHDITRKLSQQLNIPYYDRDLLRKASEVSGIHERLFGAADECIGWKEMLSAAEKVYTGEEWRDAAGYDLSLDSEQLGEDGCVELIRKILPLFT